MRFSRTFRLALVVAGLLAVSRDARAQSGRPPGRASVWVGQGDRVMEPEGLVEIFSNGFEFGDLDWLMTSAVFVPRTDSCSDTTGRRCESLIGDAVADAVRSRLGVDLVIVNSGSLRAALTCPIVDVGTDDCPAYVPPPYPITSQQVLVVLSFGNFVVSLTVTGTELKTMLENGVSMAPAAAGRFPQVSGICFTYDITQAAGSRIVSAVHANGDGSCTASPYDLTEFADYTIAELDFTATGGDGYPDFTGRFVTHERADRMLTDFILQNRPILPTIQGRSTCLGGTCPTP
ncbi:MAG: 5'-nucleotidase [Thermoanaerobaculia bacterium]